VKKGRRRATLSITLSVCFLLIACQSLRAQTPPPSRFPEKVDRLFKGRIKPAAPGAAVVVALKGKPIFMQCYGLADVEHNIPVTPETRFNLASVAKQFTAFSILLLEKEGKLGLDDDVHKFLPDLPDYSPTVTIRHLLNHTSGIWEYYSTMVYYCGYDQKDHFTLDEVMELLKHQKKLLFEPGSQWIYCNTNYVLLAQIVEKITGITFQEWTKSHIFDPLEMKDSLFMKNSSQLIPRVARCYQRQKGELIGGSDNWVNYVGQGYLFTTIKDMVRWMDNFRTKKVGGGDLVERMFRKTTLNDGSESFYGFGLGVGTRSGKQTIGHSGQTGGYKTAMLYCPELDLGIAVLANERSIDSEGLANRIFDQYLGKEEAASAVSAKKPEFLPYNQESAAVFGGGYIVVGLNAKVAVNAEEEYLHCAFFGMGEDFFYPTAERTFGNRSGINQVEFSDISNGQSQTAVLTVHGKEMTARRIALDAKDVEARLPDYPGSYYSEAFGTAYSFRPEKGRLVMHHRREIQFPGRGVHQNPHLSGFSNSMGISAVAKVRNVDAIPGCY
jgi:CubicO group peptidase (beta-lactamase class C family)